MYVTILFLCRYGHFDVKKCELFRNEDYLPPVEEKDATDNLPNQEEELLKLLESTCPRCGQVNIAWPLK